MPSWTGDRAALDARCEVATVCTIRGCETAYGVPP